MDNRQQARDVANATERGIERGLPASSDAQPLVIQVPVVINDRIVQEMEIVREDLQLTRRL